MEMLVCEKSKETTKIPIYDGMDLEDVRGLRKHAKMFLAQKRILDEMRKAIGNISEEERKKLGW